MSSDDTARTMLRVARGDPTPEELAALVAVVAARASTGPGTGAPGRSGWSDPVRAVRTPVRPGPGGWRRSALPR